MVRQNGNFIKMPWTLAFFMLLFILQGCTTPLVSVKVSSGPGCPTSGDGLGLCNSMSWTGSADGFYQDPKGPNLPENSGITCRSGSRKCKSYPGDCSGINCISRIKNIADNKGDCYCGCPF